MKKVHLELGGKAAAVVFADADLEWTAQRLCRSAFYNTGQDCTAVTRILVEQAVREKLSECLTGEINKIQLGDPIDPQTTMGPLVSKTQLEKVATLSVPGNRARKFWWVERSLSVRVISILRR